MLLNFILHLQILSLLFKAAFWQSILFFLRVYLPIFEHMSQSANIYRALNVLGSLVRALGCKTSVLTRLESEWRDKALIDEIIKC